MERKLYIVRHAEAEDFGFSTMLKDFDRNLTGRGLSQSARLGNYLSKLPNRIELFVSSPANRAHQTAKVLLEQLKKDDSEIETNRELYGGGARAYLACLNKVDDKIATVAIFGHNPDISFFAEYLTKDDVGGGMKKASMIVLSFKDLSWKEISAKSGDLIERVDVKDLMM